NQLTNIHKPNTLVRRVNALKQLQVKYLQIKAKYYIEIHELECKYAKLYQPMFDERRAIITGEAEANYGESESQSGRGDEEDLLEGQEKKVPVSENKQNASDENDPKGIPEFWLTIFKNVKKLSNFLLEHEQPIVKLLQDIKLSFSDPGEPMSFTLDFCFELNEYFTNTVLKRVYKMRCEPDPKDPFSFKGPIIVGSEGTAINWKEGMNINFRRNKKKQKVKDHGTVICIFIKSQILNDGDWKKVLAKDFEIATIFRKQIIPRAVLYFIGKTVKDDNNSTETLVLACVEHHLSDDEECNGNC
uniref:Nucleosome assembly protein 1-like 4b n=1 Tax=Erpetoichthys calabaricus TaxID=27687 RepID=A0A8C4T3W7_ERPCA